TFRSRHPEVALLAIGSRPQESRDQLCAAARDRRLSFPILIDPGGRVARQWYTEQTPRAFLVASDMRLLYRGAIDNFQFPADPNSGPSLHPRLAALLAHRPLPHPETASFGCAIKSVYYQLQKIL